MGALTEGHCIVREMGSQDVDFWVFLFFCVCAHAGGSIWL